MKLTRQFSKVPLMFNPDLDRLAQAVNNLWNEYRRLHIKEIERVRGQWLTWRIRTDVKLTRADLLNFAVEGGLTKQLGLPFEFLGVVAQAYLAQATKSLRKPVRARGSKSRGWLPFKAGTIVFRDGKFVLPGYIDGVFVGHVEVMPKHFFSLPPGHEIDSGEFFQDEDGNWAVTFESRESSKSLLERARAERQALTNQMSLKKRR